VTGSATPEELLPELNLHWLNEPEQARLDRVQLTAGPATDWFIDPRGHSDPILNAPALVGRTRGDFLLHAHVAVELGSTFDAGALVCFSDWRTWAKLCLERSPEGEPTVVSVVTRDTSDDCNSFALEASHAWLRIARIATGLAFHTSTDSVTWRLIRHFALPIGEELLVGFEAQSPLGPGCTATFTGIRYDRATLQDIRSGA
jgi:regulation of enolase protein 1 (concanavalin A-like superfamily)